MTCFFNELFEQTPAYSQFTGIFNCRDFCLNLCTANVVEPNHVEEESVDNFDTWDNFNSPEKDDKDGEVKCG